MIVTRVDAIQTDDKIKEIVDRYRDCDPDTTIPYTDILAIYGGRDHNEQRCRALCQKLKRTMLRDVDRLLVPVPNVGYRVCHARENALKARNLVRAGGRRLRAAFQTVVHTRTNELSTTERMRQLEMEAHLGSMVGLLSTGTKQMGRLVANGRQK